jgi:O-antigen ligase
VFFFSLFLFLLSSKLVIAFYIIYIFYYLATFVRENKRNKTAVMLLIGGFATFCVFLFSTDNVISRRFIEIGGTDFGILKKEKFSENNYFNGLQFRLLQWKFVPQILNEKKAWFTGVGVGDAQETLNDKYIAENMYTGTAARGDKGFLGYNTHNEFLQALLQTGIPGLLLYLLICIAVIKLMFRKPGVQLIFISILLLAYSLSESVFESQYSSIIFLFFPLFFYVDGNNDKR